MKISFFPFSNRNSFPFLNSCYHRDPGMIFNMMEKSQLKESLLTTVTIHVTATSLFKSKYRGFPGGPVVSNLPCNTGDAGSTSSSGRSHMPWGNQTCVPPRLGPPRAPEPQLLKAAWCSGAGRHSEKPEHHGSEALLTAAGESQGPAKKTQHGL